MKKIIHSKQFDSVSSPKSSRQKTDTTVHKVCYVQWRDAFTETDEWHTSESLTSEDYLCETIGFLIEDNNSKTNYISIAGTVTMNGNYTSIINIPKAMIVTKKLVTFT